MSGFFNPDRIDVVETSYVSTVLVVGGTAVEAKVGGSRLAGRQILSLYNDGGSVVYYGPSTVTTSGSNKGIPLFKDQQVDVPIGDQGLYLISAGTANVIVQEIG